MAAKNLKTLREKVTRMLSAWLDGAAEILFMGIKREDMADLWSQAESLEREIDDLLAQKKIKDEQLANIYSQLSDMTVNVGSGVRGDKSYGDDSALYGAMGFVRKSERKSGLTRKGKSSLK